MKAELERIWNDNKCRMPLHLIWWRYNEDDKGSGYKETDKIWYSKGKRLNFKNVKSTSGKSKKATR